MDFWNEKSTPHAPGTRPPQRKFLYKLLNRIHDYRSIQDNHYRHYLDLQHNQILYVKILENAF